MIRVLFLGVFAGALVGCTEAPGGAEVAMAAEPSASTGTATSGATDIFGRPAQDTTGSIFGRPIQRTTTSSNTGIAPTGTAPIGTGGSGGTTGQHFNSGTSPATGGTTGQHFNSGTAETTSNPATALTSTNGAAKR